jgi:hypothetical protein
MIKEFLENLYKQCVHKADAVDQLFDVIPLLAKQHKFDVLNQILVEMDLSRVDTSTMYSLIHLISPYINQLPHYKKIYQEIREEFARRGETSEHINKLFDKYENGWEDRLFDPNAPPYKSPEQKREELLDSKIAWANQIGDKDLVDMLTYYKASLLSHKEKHSKFHQMRNDMGEDEMRKRCIKSLKDMANLLEKSTSCWPGIYYCNLPDDPLLKETFIDGIEVVISYPWPG